MASASSNDSTLDSWRRSWEREISNKRSGDDHQTSDPNKRQQVLQNGVVPGTKIPTSTSSFSEIFHFNRKNSIARSLQVNQAGEDSFDQQSEHLKKFVIGLDYGTTFTSVSYSIHPTDEEPLRAFPWDVKSITDWPNAGSSRNRKQVPTESWYSSIPIDREKPRYPGNNSNGACEADIRNRSHRDVSQASVISPL